MTKTTTIFNQDDPIGTIWANTKAEPIELYERREGMFKFIGYAKAKNDLVPRHIMRKPHKKDFQLYPRESGAYLLSMTQEQFEERLKEVKVKPFKFNMIQKAIEDKKKLEEKGEDAQIGKHDNQ